MPENYDKILRGSVERRPRQVGKFLVESIDSKEQFAERVLTWEGILKKMDEIPNLFELSADDIDIDELWYDLQENYIFAEIENKDTMIEIMRLSCERFEEGGTICTPIYSGIHHLWLLQKGLDGYGKKISIRWTALSRQ